MAVCPLVDVALTENVCVPLPSVLVSSLPVSSLNEYGGECSVHNAFPSIENTTELTDDVEIPLTVATQLTEPDSVPASGADTPNVLVVGGGGGGGAGGVPGPTWETVGPAPAHGLPDVSR